MEKQDRLNRNRTSVVFVGRTAEIVENLCTYLIWISWDACVRVTSSSWFVLYIYISPVHVPLRSVCSILTAARSEYWQMHGDMIAQYRGNIYDTLTNIVLLWYVVTHLWVFLWLVVLRCIWRILEHILCVLYSCTCYSIYQIQSSSWHRHIYISCKTKVHHHKW